MTAHLVPQSVCRFGDSMLEARVAERTGRHPRAAERGAPEPEPEPEAAPPHPDRWHELFRSEVVLGLGRIVALHYCSSALFQIR